MTRTITVERSISMGHRLPSYNGICSSPHGHNVRVVVTVLLGHVNDFIDFKELDESLWKIIEPMDHAMVLQAEDPLVFSLVAMKFRVVKLAKEPTTEYLAEHILYELAREGFNVESVTVHETNKYSATVRP